MIRKDDRVYDTADPRHVGIVRRLNTTMAPPLARVQWEETGWFSLVSVAHLRVAPTDWPTAPVEQQIKMLTARIKELEAKVDTLYPDPTEDGI